MSDGSKGPLAPPSPNVWACHDLRDQDRKYWQARAGELKVSEDDRTSKAATTWAATLSTLAGVTAIFAILESYDRIAALPTKWQILTIGLLLVSLGLVVYAIGRAFRAQAGDLTDFTGGARTTCEYVSDEPENRAVAIRHSRWAALTSLVFLVAAILVIANAPTVSSPQQYLAIPSSGSVVCGVLQANDQGIVSLVDKPGGSTLLIMDQDAKVSDLMEVKSCGKTEQA